MKCNRCDNPSVTTVETRHFGKEDVCQGCAEALRVDAQIVGARYTLSDLTDKRKLIAWLNADGKPPLVKVAVKNEEASTSRYGYGASYHNYHTETRPVSDEDTLSIWWNDHRNALALEWSKSALNTTKPQTHKQFIAECLRSIGIKGFGTVEERVKRACALRPDLYVSAESVQAREEAERIANKQAQKERIAS